MLGYAGDQKGYRLFNLKKKRVIISRDVVFKEEIFPFLITSANKEGRRRIMDKAHSSEQGETQEMMDNHITQMVDADEERDRKVDAEME